MNDLFIKFDTKGINQLDRKEFQNYFKNLFDLID